MSEWIKCSERMPEKGQHVLGWLPGYRPGFVWLSDMPPKCPACRECPEGPHLHGALWPLNGGTHVTGSRVTHWMPLPAPPTDSAPAAEE